MARFNLAVLLGTTIWWYSLFFYCIWHENRVIKLKEELELLVRQRQQRAGEWIFSDGEGMF